jgi:four helix bundle protein
MPRRTRPPHHRVHPRLRAVTAIARSVPSAGDAPLDAERLDVYAVALEFHLLSVAIAPQKGHGELRDNLERASASIVMNTAEGAGRVWTAEKAEHYAIARESATECAALIDTLRALRLIAPETSARARSLIVRIVRMLTRLGHRFGQREAPEWSGKGNGKGKGPGNGH